MLEVNLNGLWRAGLLLLGPLLACAIARQTPQPAAPVEQLAFEIQTATPTVAPLMPFSEAPTDTPESATITPSLTSTLAITLTPSATSTLTATSTIQTDLGEASAATTPEPVAPEAPPVVPTPTVPLAEPLWGGVWSFEEGFSEWPNPYGDRCPGSGLANGWNAFTSRDQYGSSCMNQTVWRDNVQTGESAQELTFAYVGVQAGIFKSAPTLPGHRYTIEAYMRREFSPATVEVALGVDLSGGTDWQAGTVQWFPWREDLDDAWARTEETIMATGESMTIFIKGAHPYPEPGGTLRLDSISIMDIGPG